MATGSSLNNFLTFLFPSQLPHQNIKPTSQIIIPTSSSSSSDPFPTPLSSSSSSTLTCISTQNRRNRDGFVPVQPIDGSSSSSSPSSSLNDVLSVVCPSLAYSNTLFFSAYHNIEVVPEEDENQEDLIQRFRKEAMKARIIPEIRRRRWYENKREEGKRKRKEAAIKNKRRRFPWKFEPIEAKEEGEKKVNKHDLDDEQDNWELPDGGVPY